MPAPTKAKSSKTATALPAKKAAQPAVTKKAAVAKKAAAPAKPAAAPQAAAKAAKVVSRARAEVPAEQRRNYVEVAAYYIAERHGFTPGRELDDWASAEAEIDRLLREGLLNP